MVVSDRERLQKKAKAVKSTHPEPHEEHHGRRPVDQSYRIVVRTALWIVAGAVFIAFAIWWFYT